MVRYHCNINIPVPFIDYEHDYDKFQEIVVDRTRINSEFIDWLSGLGLSFFKARFFNSLPHQNYLLHIDGKADVECTKLNIVFNSHESVMNWYRPLDGYSGKYDKNTVGEYIPFFEKNKCRVVHSARVDTNCIVQGNRIHDLQNQFNNGKCRKCYSFFLLDSKTQRRLTWTGALDVFKNYLMPL